MHLDFRRAPSYELTSMCFVVLVLLFMQRLSEEGWSVGSTRVRTLFSVVSLFFDLMLNVHVRLLAHDLGHSSEIAPCLPLSFTIGST